MSKGEGMTRQKEALRYTCPASHLTFPPLPCHTLPVPPCPAQHLLLSTIPPSILPPSLLICCYSCCSLLTTSGFIYIGVWCILLFLVTGCDFDLWCCLKSSHVILPLWQYRDYWSWVIIHSFIRVSIHLPIHSNKRFIYILCKDIVTFIAFKTIQNI